MNFKKFFGQAFLENLVLLFSIIMEQKAHREVVFSEKSLVGPIRK